MDIDVINNTKPSNMIITPTFIWCFLMPSIHILSLISNILCIIVFCSTIFIKRPIAIYFICLLISDSITLLIGYIEMIDRESHMIDKSSLLCIFNGKIIHKITGYIYAFMERFCFEWILYKVLWTRASTILLAILSVQRTRTFFSLYYHESRLCAFLACTVSVFFASIITCLEWTSVQYDKVNNINIYDELFQSVTKTNLSQELYSSYLIRNYNESMNNYPCMVDVFNITSIQSNCSSNEIALEFSMITKSLLSNRDQNIIDQTSNLLTNLTIIGTNSLIMEHIQITKTPEFILKLFEKRTCHITLSYPIWLTFYDFIHSVKFTFSRHTLAIFFGNALPSFIVVLANLLSIKVIYFSKSLKYLKQTKQTNRRKRRLQNDFRAFLVILIESFSIILISWGIPIFLTMYHCNVLYVLVITTCPKIKDYLAVFLFIDIFNSSTNCLSYSLSGKLFRRKFISILKTFLTCGYGILWHKKKNSSLSLNQPLDRQPSNNPSFNTINNNNFAKQSLSRAGSYRLSQRLSYSINNQNRKLNNSIQSTFKYINGQNRNVSDDGSLSIAKTSDDQNGRNNSLSENELDSITKSNNIQLRKSPQSIKTYLIHKVRSLSSTSSPTGKLTSVNHPSTLLAINKRKTKRKKKNLNSIISRRQPTTDLSLSSSSFKGSISYHSQQPYSLNNRYSSSKIVVYNTIDNSSITDNNIHENLTSL